MQRRDTEETGLDAADWSSISECLEQASVARNLGEFYACAVAGAERLVRSELGATCYRYDKGLPRWVHGGPEGMGSRFNDYFRYRFPLPVRFADRSTRVYVMDFAEFEESEYVRDFLRPAGVVRILGAVYGCLNLSVLRGSSEALFSVNDGFRLEAFRRHLEGLHHWMRIAEEALLRSGGNDLGASLPQPLSPREAEVAFEAAHGLCAREIGLALNISPRTAERHLANIYDKLGIGSREELRAFIRAPVPAPDAATDRTDAPRDESRNLLHVSLDARLSGGDIGRR